MQPEQDLYHHARDTERLHLLKHDGLSPIHRQAIHGDILSPWRGAGHAESCVCSVRCDVSRAEMAKGYAWTAGALSRRELCVESGQHSPSWQQPPPLRMRLARHRPSRAHAAHCLHAHATCKRRMGRSMSQRNSARVDWAGRRSWARGGVRGARMARSGAWRR